MNKWLEKEEAAQFLGISVQSLQGLMDNDKITYYVIAKKSKFLQKDIEDYIELAKRPARF